MMSEGPYLTIYLIAVLLALGVAVYAWQQRRVVGAVPFAFNALLQASWTLGYIFELMADSQSGKLFWDNMQWIGSLGVPAATLIFALQFTGHPVGYSRRLWIGLSVFPIIFLALTFSDDWHGLIHANIRLEPARPFDVLLYDYTPAIWIAAVYLYAVILIGLYLILRRALSLQGVLRGQAVMVLTGYSVAVVGGVLSLAEVTLSGQRDATPLFFAVGNVVMAWGLFRFRLFNLVPVARDRVFDTIDDLIIVLDGEGRVVDVNPAASKCIALPDPIGHRAARVFADWPGLLSFIEYERASTTELTRANRTYAVAEKPLRTHDGIVNGCVIVLRDITPRVEAEIAIQRHVEAIEAANRELDKARQAAEELNTMKSQFLARMSHELRTPLNAILNFTEFVARGMLGPVSPKQEEALEKSLDSGRHLMSLINDILDMSKIEANMLLLFAEDDVDLVEESRGVISAAEALLAEKPVQLIQDIDPNLPAIVADRRRIRQILLNLLSNAAKFTDQGSVTLAIKQRHDNILIMVSDTGPGICPADRELIFEAFRQTKRGQDKGTGTGLGLPITQRLVEAHGGHIWLDSEEGEGTDFFVSLPVRSEALLQTIPEENG